MNGVNWRGRKRYQDREGVSGGITDNGVQDSAVIFQAWGNRSRNLLSLFESGVLMLSEKSFEELYNFVCKQQYWSC